VNDEAKLWRSFIEVNGEITHFTPFFHGAGNRNLIKKGSAPGSIHYLKPQAGNAE
jgi:hypothetical protein